MSNGPEEPDAASRHMARMTRQWFVALMLEGFTEAQALVIIGQIIAASIVANGKGDGS